MEIPELLDQLRKRILSKAERLSLRKKILFISVIWVMIFLPVSVVVSDVHVKSHFAYFPEEAAPIELDNYDWNVRLNPNDEKQNKRYVINVEEGDEITFTWRTENYTGPYHIGRINVFYNTSWGEKGRVRLLNKNIDSYGKAQCWEGTKRFQNEGKVYYHYRLDMGDVSIFDRRGSVLLEGKNLYEAIRTGPPPIISFFFIPAVLLAPHISSGGFLLSFYIYFSLFILLDSLLIFYTFKKRDETKAFLASLIFMLNPITAQSMFQDESIIVLLIILSMMMIIRNKNKLAYFLTGLGISVKIWTFFFIPAKIFDKKESMKERILYPAISGGVALSSLLFFYLLWGRKSLWFMSFYSGTSEKKAVGGEAFLAALSRTPLLSESQVHTSLLLILVSIVILLVLTTGYKKNWEVIVIFTAIVSVFFAIYPKVHWEYYMILFPSLVYLASGHKKFFAIFYGLVSVQTVTRLVREYEIFQNIIGESLAVICSLTASLLLLWVVYLFYKDEAIPKFKRDTGET